MESPFRIQLPMIHVPAHGLGRGRMARTPQGRPGVVPSFYSAILYSVTSIMARRPSAIMPLMKRLRVACGRRVKSLRVLLKVSFSFCLFCYCCCCCYSRWMFWRRELRGIENGGVCVGLWFGRRFRN